MDSPCRYDTDGFTRQSVRKEVKPNSRFSIEMSSLWIGGGAQTIPIISGARNEGRVRKVDSDITKEKVDGLGCDKRRRCYLPM